MPGPSGSIYDSKPVSGGAHSTAGAGTPNIQNYKSQSITFSIYFSVSGSSSNVYNTGTTVHTVQPVVVPVAPGKYLITMHCILY